MLGKIHRHAKRVTWRGICILVVGCWFGQVLAQPMDSASPLSAEPSARRVAILQYAQGKRATCFSTGFLQTLMDHGKHQLESHFTVVNLEGDEPLAGYSVLIWGGDRRFALSEAERQRLRDYLAQGGFILASASCSHADWGDSFRQEFARLWPEAVLEEMRLDHPALRDGPAAITKLEARMPTKLPLLQGWTDQGRLRLVFSTVGLNDTDNAGPGCCCCGGNELKHARSINANLVHYALNLSK